MAGDEEIQVDISATAVCRILTVSTSRRQATALVNLVKCLIEASSSDATASEEEQIPWTISNKYYSADVHFAPHAIHGLSPHRVQNVPAVIFAWAHGEAYKHHIQRLANDLDGYEPEVCLAVRLDPTQDIKDEDRADEEDLREEENAIDEFLASHGFEFVDASARSTPRAEESTETHTEAMSHGIPRLPRVVDALSTIMWPSMQSQARPRATRGRSAELLDWAQDSPDTSIALDTDHSRAAVDDIVARSGSGLAAQEGRMRREMEALERWLEKDDFDFHDDPWRFSARAGGSMVSSPLSEESLSVFGARTPSAAQTLGATQSPGGFDDDFTVFVSAPPTEAHDGDASFTSHTSLHADASFTSNASLNSHTSFDAPFSFDRARSRSNSLAPHAGPFYHSLGSVSDFGDEQAPGPHDILPSDDEDEDLPSQDEIREASARIFGAPHASSSSTGAPSSSTGAPPSTSGAPPSSTAPNPTGALTGPTTAAPHPTAEDDDDYEMAPFDLSRVMSALQGMKAEIAGMENEDERRKAAAKVALGLVYGLEAERGGLEAERGGSDEERGGPDEARRADGVRVGGEDA